MRVPWVLVNSANESLFPPHAHCAQRRFRHSSCLRRLYVASPARRFRRFRRSSHGASHQRRLRVASVASGVPRTAHRINVACASLPSLPLHQRRFRRFRRINVASHGASHHRRFQRFKQQPSPAAAPVLTLHVSNVSEQAGQLIALDNGSLWAPPCTATHQARNVVVRLLSARKCRPSSVRARF